MGQRKKNVEGQMKKVGHARGDVKKKSGKRES